MTRPLQHKQHGLSSCTEAWPDGVLSMPYCCPRRSLSTVRVMVITRSAFESIERTFPIASRLVLENLKRRSEAQVG